ncbi:hypothetical protein IEO21_06739 [Rhodonia placenta]|uniref:BTB domain-containing protein n=1 Tax=Rhodonia placenta TaxID=104341 RepID=A0A8H7NZG8_9APHY|nr:hypothetical protein IEO21_06739 [Postia placenta]
MSEPLRNKRPRVDSNDGAFVNHPSLYFEDGNVILSCDSTLFRVHRSLLSKHSPVFRDLLEDKEDQKQHYLRECIHVALSDTGEEMEALLNVIYDGLRFDLLRLTVDTFPTLANVFRMSTKYRIGRPREEIIQRIKRDWPSDLAMHDVKFEVLRRELMQQSAFLTQAGRIVANPQYNTAIMQNENGVIRPASVIALLRQGGCNTPEILAPLFYALSCDTWQFGGPAVGHHVAPLAHDDIERFIAGLERLRSAHASAASHCSLMLTPSHAESCLPGVRRYWSDLAGAMLRRTGRRRQPIEEWRDAAILASQPGYFSPYAVCGGCVRSLIAGMFEIRGRLWVQLPHFFELV